MVEGEVRQASPLDEQSLVERARRDPDAFAALYRMYLDRIHAFAYRRTGSREVSEDITAATFERALRALPSFEWKGGGFGAWLFRIAANELNDHYRARYRERGERAQGALRLLGSERLEPADDEHGGFDAGDRDRLLAALGGLRPRYQRAISLRYLAGLDASEAAEAMGCSKPTLAVTLHRALAALRRQLEARDVAEEATT